MDVLSATEESAKENLQSVGGGGNQKRSKNKQVAGWNEYVEPYYQESKF